MRDDMEPSTTMKCLLPLVLTPVTVLTSAEVLPTMERPGSMMIVSPSSVASLRMVSSSCLCTPCRPGHAATRCLRTCMR